MAISTEAANKAWQRVKIALAGATPFANKAFRELKAHLAQAKGNPDLQVVAQTDASYVAAGGTVVADAACTLYGWYVKKIGTGTGTATDAWVKIYDDATNDGTGGDAMFALPLLVANDERLYLDGAGFPCATGIVAVGHTTLLGTTDSTATDTGAGFILLGA